MKNLFILFVALLAWSCASAQGCLPEGITFETQAQLDSFQINYPGCTEIEGEVIISGADITSLSGLSVLTRVGSNLIIIKNDLLTNLTGLDALTTIGGYLEIGDNNDEDNLLLASLTGLENLTSTGGGMSIRFNPSLTSFDGLDNLTSIGEGGFLLIQVNNALTSISALHNLTNVGGDLRVEANDILTNLDGLDNIAAGSIHNLFINRNPSLSTCEVQSICEYLASPTGIVFIFENAPGCEHPPDIASGCGITLQCLPYGYYHFYSQSYIDNFQAGFPGCTVLEGYAVIYGEDITNLNGLSVVTTVNGDLRFDNNPNLTSLTGMENLTNIEGSLWIAGNPLLTGLTGLESLDSVNGDLYIGLNYSGGNLALASLSELSNLDYVGGDLEIWNNPALTSLEGLDNMGVDSVDALVIQNNPALSTCEVQSICDYLGNPDAYVWISGNASGCNSQEEVAAACDTTAGVLPADSRQPIVVSYPNPFSEYMTFEYELEESGTVNLMIFNHLGQEVEVLLDGQQDKGRQQVQWNTERLPSGLYFYRLTTHDSRLTTTGKLVKY
jgi:hypothetical protein